MEQGPLQKTPEVPIVTYSEVLTYYEKINDTFKHNFAFKKISDYIDEQRSNTAFLKALLKTSPDGIINLEMMSGTLARLQSDEATQINTSFSELDIRPHIRTQIKMYLQAKILFYIKNPTKIEEEIN